MYSRNQAQPQVGKCPTLPLKKIIVEPPLLYIFQQKVHRPIRNENIGKDWLWWTQQICNQLYLRSSGDVWRPSATNNSLKVILHTTLKHSAADEYREMLVLAQSYLLIWCRIIFQSHSLCGLLSEFLYDFLSHVSVKGNRWSSGKVLGLLAHMHICGLFPVTLTLKERFSEFWNGIWMKLLTCHMLSRECPLPL